MRELVDLRPRSRRESTRCAGEAGAFGAGIPAIPTSSGSLRSLRLCHLFLYAQRPLSPMATRSISLPKLADICHVGETSENLFYFFRHISWHKFHLVVKTPSTPQYSNCWRMVKPPSRWVFGLTEINDFLQLVSSVILVISKGFVNFDSNGELTAWFGGLN